jgi:hypothetical protein
MAAATVQIAALNTTNTTFAAWAQNISSHFTSAGWVKSGDTGQINWATFTGVPPATAKLKIGYEIWHMNDAFQATSPVYLRIDYGSGSVNTAPGIWIQLGSGEANNGVGQLTGPLSSPHMGGSNLLNIGSAAAQANTENCYFSGNSNYINTWMWTNKDGGASQSTMIGFSLERTKDSDGNDTGQGVLFTAHGASVFYQTVWDCFIGQAFNHELGLGTLMPATLGGVNGSNTSVYPVFHALGNSFLNPGLNILTYFNTDIANNTTTNVSIYGANHTYIATSSQAIPQNTMRPGAGVGLLLRYE